MTLPHTLDAQPDMRFDEMGSVDHIRKHFVLVRS